MAFGRVCVAIAALLVGHIASYAPSSRLALATARSAHDGGSVGVGVGDLALVARIVRTGADVRVVHGEQRRWRAWIGAASDLPVGGLSAHGEARATAGVLPVR